MIVIFCFSPTPFHIIYRSDLFHFLDHIFIMRRHQLRRHHSNMLCNHCILSDCAKQYKPHHPGIPNGGWQTTKFRCWPQVLQTKKLLFHLPQTHWQSISAKKRLLFRLSCAIATLTSHLENFVSGNWHNPAWPYLPYIYSSGWFLRP